MRNNIPTGKISPPFGYFGSKNRLAATIVRLLPPHNAWVEDWAVRRKTEYSDTYGYLGYLAASRNEAQKSEACYLKAVELNPGNVNVLKNLAVLYSRAGHMDKAIPIWQKLYAIAPNDPDVQRVFQQQQPPKK